MPGNNKPSNNLNLDRIEEKKERKTDRDREEKCNICKTSGHDCDKKTRN
jgi:hypothetical protein